MKNKTCNRIPVWPCKHHLTCAYSIFCSLKWEQWQASYFFSINQDKCLMVKENRRWFTLRMFTKIYLLRHPVTLKTDICHTACRASYHNAPVLCMEMGNLDFCFLSFFFLSCPCFLGQEQPALWERKQRMSGYMARIIKPQHHSTEFLSLQR